MPRWQYFVYRNPENGAPWILARADERARIERASYLVPVWEADQSLVVNLFGEDNLAWDRIDRGQAETAADAIGVNLDAPRTPVI